MKKVQLERIGNRQLAIGNSPSPRTNQNLKKHAELRRTQYEKLPLSFYQRSDVVLIARELLGKILVTNWKGIITSGRIVECEAYAGVIDKASHAFGERRTP